MQHACTMDDNLCHIHYARLPVQMLMESAEKDFMLVLQKTAIFNRPSFTWSNAHRP